MSRVKIKLPNFKLIFFIFLLSIFTFISPLDKGDLGDYLAPLIKELPAGLRILIPLSPFIKVANAATINKPPFNYGLTRGLVGHWTFDSKDLKNNVADRSGSGNTGYLKNFTSTSSAVTLGKIGQGLLFDGVNDYVNVAGLTSTQIVHPLTLVAWVKLPSSASGNKTIISNSGASNGFDWFIDVTNKQLKYKAGTSLSVGSGNNTINNLNQWNHFVVKIDASNNATFYFNGTQVGTAGSVAISMPGNIQLGIVTSNTEPLSGLIDDVRIYNRALSPAEIKELYNIGAETKYQSSDNLAPNINRGLVGHWTFDSKDLKNNVVDRSGLGNTGYMQGFTSTSSAVTAGKIGQGLKFNGGSSKITIGALSSATPCGTYTTSGSGSDSGTTYGTVLGDDGKCWLDRNLGATQAATASNDSSSYGYYYQWGRLTDGHQVSTSGTTATNSSEDVPGHGNFITEADSPYDWRVPQNDNLWQGASGTNNPCPSGFRLPTGGAGGEWSTLVTAEGITNAATAFSSSLKLPLAGFRSRTNGLLDSPGSDGIYRSSSPNGANAYHLYFNSSSADPAGYGTRAGGSPVRCVSDTTSFSNPSDSIGATAASASAWVYPKSYGEGNEGRILDNGKFILKIISTNSTASFSSDGSTQAVASTNAIPLNKWTHVAVLRNTSGTANLYINGILSGTANQSSGTPAGGSSNVIVGNNNAGAYTFDGQIDDVRIYTRALTPSEIKELYNIGAEKLNSSFSPPDLKKGLVGHWTFDSKDLKNNVVDRSGLGNTGYMKGFTSTSSAQVAGKLGQGLKFDGVNDSINVGSGSSLDDIQNQGGGGMTISLWIKLNSNTNDQKVIMAKSNGTSNSGTWVITKYQNSPTRISFSKEGVTDSVIYYNNALQIGSWKHIVFTWNGSMTFSTGVQLYKNGSLFSPYGSVTDGASPNTDASGLLCLGNYSNGTNTACGSVIYNPDMAIDDVRIYNRILSTSEIKQLYLMGK